MDDIDLIGGRHSRDAFRFPVISTEPAISCTSGVREKWELVNSSF
jgi:hypothetical protein